MLNEKDEFNFVELPPECRDESISKDDFKLVQVDAKIHDQKFETKPTTFFKDCFRRFVKNKSSVVAAFILGLLVVMSVIVPIFFKTSDVHDTSKTYPELYYLEPKLFPAGTGFWDGTKKMVDIPVDTNASEDPKEWGPDYTRYNKTAISNLEIGEEKYTTSPNELTYGGFIQFGYYDNIPNDVDYISYSTDPSYIEIEDGIDFDLDVSSLKVTKFVTYDKERLAKSDEKTKEFPVGYVEAKSALYFSFEKGITSYSFALTEDYEKKHDVGGEEAIIDVKAKLNDFIAEYNADPERLPEEIITDRVFTNPRFEIRVENAKDKKFACTLIQKIEIECNSYDPVLAKQFTKYSFKDGNDVFIRPSVYSNTNGVTDEEKEKKAKYSGIWSNTNSSDYTKDIDYLVRFVPCSFVYDTYEAALGRMEKNFYNVELNSLRLNNIIKYEIKHKEKVAGKWVVTDLSCEILDSENCPFIEPFKAEDVVLDNDGDVVYIKCQVYKYKTDPYNLDKMPIFLMGTDKSGKDMFIYVFEGLRTSLLLGIATSAICFLFGLFWGAVCGYFGGNVDLIMERLTDILSGIPWIVVMTLTIIHLGSTFFTFALALCLTGWIGTAATTRTQFYRFRGREYVLASRTLGASHARLISRHILPNAMGTIITSAVLMVPSVIFSEATISYLGLGFKNLASLGVILSDNQVELTNHPYLLIFPAIIIALLMISFNLFGNGLRDAVNPSLKGEGE